MEELLTQLAGYGLPGIMLGVAVYFIRRMQDIHQSERKEWREESVKQHQELVGVTKDTHSILSKIETMLEK